MRPAATYRDDVVLRDWEVCQVLLHGGRGVALRHRLVHQVLDTGRVVRVPTAERVVAVMGEHDQHRVLWVVLGGNLLDVLRVVARVAVLPAHRLG